MEGLYVLVGLTLIVLFWIIGIYNSLIRLRQHVRDSWSGIETELRRRYDLIPNLVNTVKGYAAHEKEVLTAVTEARTQALAIRRRTKMFLSSNWGASLLFLKLTRI